MLRVPLEKVVLVLNKSGAEGGLTSEQVRSNLTLPVALEIPNHPMATNRTMQTGDALVVTAPDSVIADRVRTLASILSGSQQAAKTKRQLLPSRR